MDAIPVRYIRTVWNIFNFSAVFSIKSRLQKGLGSFIGYARDFTMMLIDFPRERI